jgi:hypothetical protein
MQLAAVLVAGGLTVAACGNSLKLGAAATTGTGRITSAALTDQVANLASAYKTDQHKGVKPQRTTGQEPQQVLNWLLTFRIFDKLAEQRGINVSRADVQRQLAGLSAQAKQQKLTTAGYVSAAGAVPPDLVPQIGRYFAILTAFQNRLDGGKSPTATAAQSALEKRVAHAQCVAAKSLNIKVNPQYGEYDYGTFSVVAAPSKLAASPSASASAKPKLAPPC